MSRTLSAALIFLSIVAGCYFAISMATELWDLLWKIRHNG